MTRNWADRLFEAYCVSGSFLLLAMIAATLYGWPR